MLLDNIFKNKSVLVVEDEALVALGLVASLEDLGAEIIGPAYDLDSALQLAYSTHPDCAILDFKIGDFSVLPVAEALSQRGIPFIFVTGFSDLALPKELDSAVSIQKPFAHQDLTSALITAMSGQMVTA